MTAKQVELKKEKRHLEKVVARTKWDWLMWTANIMLVILTEGDWIAGMIILGIITVAISAPAENRLEEIEIELDTLEFERI